MLPIERFSEKQSILAKAWRKLTYPGWEGYVSLTERPGLMSKLNFINPLFVVHPGFANYFPDGDRVPDDDPKYLAYLDRLRQKIQQTIEAGRTVVVLTPSKYKNQTLSTIKRSVEVMLLPTLGVGVALDDRLMGLNTHQFPELLSENVHEAEICGEYSGRCVYGFEIANPNIKFHRVKDCIYPHR